MKSEWKIKKLGDLCNISSSKRIFAKEYCSKGIPFYRGKEIIEKNKGNAVSTELFISEERYAEIKERNDVPKIGDILLSSVGTLGVPWLVDEENFYFKDGNLTWLRVGEELDNKFLYLWLCSPEAKQQIDAKCIGSTQKAITIETLSKFDICIPSIDTQRKISNILFAIINKIVLNKKVNDNLHEQIQALYLSNFDPAIQKPMGILSDICYYSSKKIPIAMLTVDTYFSTENMQANKIGAIKATSLPNISQTTKCYPGDVLVSNIRPYFKKIVYVASECGCSTDVLCFCPNTERLSAFLFSTLYVDRFFDYMVAGSKGTKMPRGDKKQIMNYPIVIPSDIQLQQFNTSIVPMLNQIELLKMENMRLAEIRDALLPQLMSGELDVSTLNL